MDQVGLCYERQRGAHDPLKHANALRGSNSGSVKIDKIRATARAALDQHVDFPE